MLEKLGDSSKEWLMVLVMLETNLTGGSNQRNLSLSFSILFLCCQELARCCGGGPVQLLQVDVEDSHNIAGEYI